METTLYLATNRGLTVIAGSDGHWRGKVCLKDKQVQCVVADSNKKGFVYCGTLGVLCVFCPRENEAFYVSS